MDMTARWADKQKKNTIIGAPVAPRLMVPTRGGGVTSTGGCTWCARKNAGKNMHSNLL